MKYHPLSKSQLKLGGVPVRLMVRDGKQERRYLGVTGQMERGSLPVLVIEHNYWVEVRTRKTGPWVMRSQSNAYEYNLLPTPLTVSVMTSNDVDFLKEIAVAKENANENA